MAKNLVMESLYKLKNLEAKFNTVIVTHDMTRKEREDCKNLVEEAKAKTAQDPSGEWIYRVRGSPGKFQIIQFKRRY